MQPAIVACCLKVFGIKAKTSRKSGKFPNRVTKNENKILPPTPRQHLILNDSVVPFRTFNNFEHLFISYSVDVSIPVEHK